MAQNYNVPFWFVVHDMYEDLELNLQPRGTHNNWLPQQQQGSNVDASTRPEVVTGGFIPGSNFCRKGSHNQFRYYFNGTSVDTFNDFTPDHVRYLAIHQVFSVYFYRSVIYHVNYNAADHAVGDGGGGDTLVGDHPNSLRYMDWEEIGFHHDADRSSRIDTNANRSLQSTRDGCDWPRQILPGRYLPEHQESQNRQHEQPPVGSLHGKLALLIALIALSASPELPNDVHTTLVRTMTGSNWMLPQYHHNHPGWVNCRGLIVTVYSISNGEHLTNWENYGLMFQ